MQSVDRHGAADGVEGIGRTGVIQPRDIVAQGILVQPGDLIDFLLLTLQCCSMRIVGGDTVSEGIYQGGCFLRWAIAYCRAAAEIALRQAHIGIATVYPGRAYPLLTNQVCSQVGTGFTGMANASSGRESGFVTEAVHQQYITGRSGIVE